MYKFRDYYVPSSKWELLRQLNKMYPHWKGLRGKSKKQLYAIYYKVMENVCKRREK